MPTGSHIRSRSIVAVAAVTLTFALAACSGGGNKPEPDLAGVYPARFKDEILREIPEVVADPTNIRDAAISDPIVDPKAEVKVYSSCVRFNPRGADKQYLGVQYRRAYFYGGHLNQFVGVTPDTCASAQFKPFPELEKLCASTKGCK
jgi:hypothetical protein